MHIDGALEGTIESSEDVSIGESGSFDGSIRARNVLVSGYLQGRIDCERLEIVPNGKVFGEVTSSEFVIESGGQFVGESHIKGSEPVKALEHRKERPAKKTEPVIIEPPAKGLQGA